MSNTDVSLKEVRRLIVRGLAIQYLPVYLVILLEPLLEQAELQSLFSILRGLSSLAFLCGYIFCYNAINQYAKYKGHKNYFKIYSLYNIYGLCVLFLLNNRNQDDRQNTEQEPILNINISSIAIGYLAIILLSSLILMLTILVISIIYPKLNLSDTLSLSDNQDILAVLNALVNFALAWYSWRLIKLAQIDVEEIPKTKNQSAIADLN